MKRKLKKTVSETCRRFVRLAAKATDRGGIRFYSWYDESEVISALAAGTKATYQKVARTMARTAGEEWALELDRAQPESPVYSLQTILKATCREGGKS